ncbi:C39 family peptidase [Thiohalocapsa sp. ML1]|uniref:C39 family peptidase n=1 Tax=Thiohalocapsa sp. ML1 TaxID=1431688 RepID=UPI0020B12979|nr:C39 family peptidase [Thiohalocapsa sp. ML1]
MSKLMKETTGMFRLFWLYCALLCVDGAHAEPVRSVRSLIEQRHESVVLQEYDLSCGAAALTTLLRYQYGEPVTEKQVALALIDRPEYLRQPELIRQQQGFSLLDLKRYADARGYTGVGFGKLDLQDLVRRAPILVAIRTHGYNHFVVFRGRLGDRVLLADPAWGNRTMTIARFNRAWIDFPGIGRVGFVVEAPAGTPTRNDLAPRADLFPTLN